QAAVHAAGRDRASAAAGSDDHRVAEGFAQRRLRNADAMRGVWLERLSDWSVTDVADADMRPGGVLVDVIAVRVPSYTRGVLTGELGYDLPVPLIPGPACIGRIRAVADDVFGLRPEDVVLCNSLYSSNDVIGSPDEILIGWTGTGTERSARMQQQWRHGSFAEQACYPADCVTPLP